jgi:hypothetical protein
MTTHPEPAEDRYTHLRAYATAQKQTTVERLKQAIVQLEEEGRPVNTFTIKEVSGLNYMAYYRNREAFSLFQQHSTHLRKEREEQQTKQRRVRRPLKRKNFKNEEAIHQVKVKPRDPLLDYKRPRLVELLRATQAERNEIKKHTQDEQVLMEQRYAALLQEHMQCGLAIARLEAELAEYRAFMDRFRSSLHHQEHESQN